MTLLTTHNPIRPLPEATAEVTSASVDNCKLIQARKADLGFVMADVAYDAFKGSGRFKAAPGAIPVRTLGVLYSNYMHFVALDGSGIKSMTDLRGKRVSTGAPGSGTEVFGDETELRRMLQVLVGSTASTSGGRHPATRPRPKRTP